MNEMTLGEGPNGERALLTTKSARLSYGVPVLVIEDGDGVQREFGVKDVVGYAYGFEITGGFLVWQCLEDRETTPEERDFTARFLMGLYH